MNEFLKALAHSTPASLADRCEKAGERFGLSLSGQQLTALLQNRLVVLEEAGQVELGEGVLPALITAFAPSPYLSQRDPAKTLMELNRLFYLLKNETEGLLEDDELLFAMEKAFDGPAGGSCEYLEGLSVEELCRLAGGESFQEPPFGFFEEEQDE